MKKRLIEFLTYLKIGQNAFEKRVGLSTGSICNLNHGLRSDKLAQIAAEYPELNMRWLLLGEGEMLREIVPLELTPEFVEMKKNVEELTKTVYLLREIIADMREKEKSIRGNVG